MLSRRQLLQAALAAMVAAGWSAPGRTQAARPLLRLGWALAAAASALGALGNNIADRIKRGLPLDKAQATRMRDRLLHEIWVFQSLSVSQAPLIDNLAEYYDSFAPQPRQSGKMGPARGSAAERSRYWTKVLRQTSVMMQAVRKALRAVRSEQSGFVDEASYRQLKRTLEGRVSLLTELQTAPAPSSAADFGALKAAVVRYEQLHSNLGRTLRLMDQYILSLR